jgi:calcineurin-like phosphoesterase family protein
MSGVFFTADLHLGHGNIIKYCNRPYSSIEEMDESLISNWNSVVGKNDHIYVVGDFTMGGNAPNYLRRLNGIKHLIRGNHDREPKLEHGWTSIHDLRTIKVGAQPIVLCHYALRVWDKSHYGALHCYGHSHGKLPDDTESLSLDVGVDCHNYTPLEFEEIKALMKSKNPKWVIKNRYA